MSKKQIRRLVPGKKSVRTKRSSNAEETDRKLLEEFRKRFTDSKSNPYTGNLAKKSYRGFSPKLFSKQIVGGENFKEEAREIIRLVQKRGTQIDLFRLRWLSSPEGTPVDISGLDLKTLLDDEDFVEFVIDNSVQFKSSDDDGLTQSISNLLSFFSQRMSSDKHHDISQVMKDKASLFALNMATIMHELDDLGFSSLKQKADELNKRGIKTSRGNNWTKAAVSRVLKRIDNQNMTPN